MDVLDALVPDRLTCDVPPGWFIKESVTLMEPGARANIILSSESLEVGVDSVTYAVAQGDLLRQEVPGYRELVFQPVPWAHAQDAHLRRFQWHPPDGPPVEQLQVTWTHRRRAYTATATASTNDLAWFEPTFLAVLPTFRGTERRAVLEQAPAGPTPLTPSAPSATLVTLDWAHQIIDAGAVIAAFPLDPARTGRSQMLVIVQVADPATYAITVQTTERHLPMDRWWDVVGAVNEWNATRRWPTASVARRKDNPHEAEVFLRHETYLPGGATMDQLADQTDMVVGCAHDFWIWAHEEQGL